MVKASALRAAGLGFGLRHTVKTIVLKFAVL